MGRYSGSMAAQPADNVAITGGSIVGITDLAVADGGTASSTAANARTALGAKYDNVSATDKVLGRSTAGAGVIEEIACTSAGRALIDDANAAAQQATLGLGTIATQAANSVSITGGSVTGTDVTATDLKSATTTIAIDAATAPSAGQVLTASSSTVAAWATPAAGGGDVVGPASATDNAVARFDTTTGKLIQNSAVIIDDSGNMTLNITPVGSIINIHATGSLGLGGYNDYQLVLGPNGGVGSVSINGTYVLFPVQASTASAPAYVLGGIYFDTTLNKLRIGGATAWETITSS